LVPTAGKLDPKLEGGWVGKSVKSPVRIKIHDGKRTKFVHFSRLQHRCVPGLKNTNTTKRDDEADSGTRDDWSPPGIEHLTISAAD